jgi:hypothetical protein
LKPGHALLLLVELPAALIRRRHLVQA